MKKFLISDFRFPISAPASGRARQPATDHWQPVIENPQSKISNRKSKFANRKSQGAALVITLCILVLVTVLVLSLFLTVTSERTESAASANQGDAQRLASSVVDLVKATITQATSGYEANADGTPIKGPTGLPAYPTAWASQPGLIRTWKQDGTPYESFRLYSSGNIAVTNQADLVTDTTDLASWKSGTSSYNALWCDLNTPASNAAGGLTYPIVTPPADANSGSTATDSANGVPTDNPASATQEGVQGFSITSSPGYTAGSASPTNNPAPMPVKWLYVLQDGSFVSPTGTATNVTVAGATQTNPIIGRVAYWTDDETCKVNINTASEGVYWDKPYGVNREDSGLSGSPTGILGYSLSVPVQDEFQRLPGHPAFTSLSAVYGGWLPRPDIGFSTTDPVNGAAAYTGGTYAGNILPYYQLTPRIGDGGTQGGTRAVLSLATAGNKITLDSDRLYASSDEFLYGPTVSGGIRAINNLSLPADQIRKTGFFVTATSKAPETTLFEQPRISLWPIQQTTTTRNAKDKLLAFASTTTNNSFPYYFQRVSEWASDDSPGSSQSTTTDVTQGRNDALLKYLLNTTQQQVPGFGAALSDKYKNGTLPQILVEMFDTVRSLVNTTSRALTPSYSYAPYGPSGSANNPVGLGSVVPARTTLGGTEVKGIGRFPTISEVIIVFMATGWNDTTTLGTAPLFTPTAGGDGLPDDVADNAGKYNGVGDPQTTAIRAFVLLIPANPVPGSPATAPAVRYQIGGLEKLKVNGTYLGFPALNDAVLITRSNFSSSTQAEGAVENQLVFGGPPPPYQPWSPAYARSSGNCDGTTASGASNDPNVQVFPFIGASISLATPAQPISFGLDTSGNYTVQLPATPPTTMSFSGGTLDIYIYPGTGNTFSTADYIQKIEVIFHPAPTLPVPQIIRSTFGGGGGVDFDTAYAVSSPTNSDFYSGATFGGDSRDFNKRLQCMIGTSAGAVTPPSVIRRGDVLRSVYIDPAGPSRGDTRVVAGLRTVPSNFYTEFPNYTSTTKLQACGAGVRFSAYRSSMAYQDTTINPGTNPYSWTNQLNHDNSEFQGKLLSLNYNARTYPSVPFGATPATLSTGSSPPPGDWNTGVGSIFDGPYINLGDQGFAADSSAGYYNIYFPTHYSTDSTSAASITSFSPNRQVSSPVLFGSLPSGITPLSSVGATGTQAPWQTLLFCPNPPAKNNHPGLGGVGTGGPGPNARPPFTTTAPDHLFLDNFWMPVVEPYAISEPFSTSGKVNLNHRIAPFNYIERSTGIYAVLKALKMAALPDSIAGSYKTPDLILPNSSTNPSWRYNIDVDAVLAGMADKRFKFNDIYHSASELCSIFLVPSKQPNATAATPAGPSGVTALDRYDATAAWWDDKTLTGDNLRESPYDQIYSRITTKSNTFTVHMRVQALKQVSNRADWATWNEATDQVVSEYRGSATIERYVDPNDTTIPDFTVPANYTKNLAPYYRWRTVSERQFLP